jgi:hypothetical protein
MSGASKASGSQWRFEIEWLATDANLEALTHRRIDRVHARKRAAVSPGRLSQPLGHAIWPAIDDGLSKVLVLLPQVGQFDPQSVEAHEDKERTGARERVARKSEPGG